MKTFKTADMQRQGKVILDTAKTEGPIRIVRGKDIFVLTYEPGEDGESETFEATKDVAPGILEEMLQVQKDILAELRKAPKAEVVRDEVQEDSCPTCLHQAHEGGCEYFIGTSGACECGWPQEARKVEIPAQGVQRPEPTPKEPTDQDLAYALDFYGIRMDPGTKQPELTQKGRETGELTLKKMVRQGHDEALRVWEMPEDSAERYLFLLAVQIDKYEKAIEKCKTGDPDWIAGAPR
jgi:hypothetical protein